MLSASRIKKAEKRVHAPYIAPCVRNTTPQALLRAAAPPPTHAEGRAHLYIYTPPDRYRRVPKSQSFEPVREKPVAPANARRGISISQAYPVFDEPTAAPALTDGEGLRMHDKLRPVRDKAVAPPTLTERKEGSINSSQAYRIFDTAVLMGNNMTSYTPVFDKAMTPALVGATSKHYPRLR